jgi:hypothetical protein
VISCNERRQHSRPLAAGTFHGHSSWPFKSATSTRAKSRPIEIRQPFKRTQLQTAEIALRLHRGDELYDAGDGEDAK